MTFIQTHSGRVVPLDRLAQPDVIDFADIAESLAKLPRFLGHTVGVVSVARHSLWASTLAFQWRDANDPAQELAPAYALIHDAHEAYCGDLTRPFVDGLARRLGFAGARHGEAFLVAVDAMKADLDAAIHARAGLAWPVPPAIADLIKRIDASLLETERREYLDRGRALNHVWHHDADPPPRVDGLSTPIERWPVECALFLSECKALLPGLAR